MGGTVNRFIPNPTFDPIIVPGCMDPLFRGQIPEGVDPLSLMQVEPLRAEYQDRDKRIEAMDEQGLGAALLFPTLGCGVEEGLRNDRRGDHGLAFCVQPLARRGLGLRLPSTASSRAPCSPWPTSTPPWRRWTRSWSAGAHRARPAGPGARAQWHGPITRAQDARSGLGPAGRGERPGRLPPRGQRVQPHHGGRLGRQRDVRGVRQHRHPEPHSGGGPGHPRHGGVADRPRRLQAPSHAAGGQHRERLRLDGAPGQTPAQAAQPDALGLRRGPARHHPTGTSGPRRTSRRTWGRWPS